MHKRKLQKAMQKKLYVQRETVLLIFIIDT